MAELVQDPGLPLDQLRYDRSVRGFAPPPQIGELVVLSAAPMACEDCPFFEACNKDASPDRFGQSTARYNAYIANDRMLAGIMQQSSQSVGDNDWVGRALDDVTRVYSNQVDVIDRFETAGRDGQCAGGETREVQTTHQTWEYVDAGKQRWGGFRQRWMRISGKAFANHTRTISVCANPVADEAIGAQVDFAENPAGRTYPM